MNHSESDKQDQISPENDPLEREEGYPTVVVVPGKVDEKFKQYLQILRNRGAIGEPRL